MQTSVKGKSGRERESERESRVTVRVIALTDREIHFRNKSELGQGRTVMKVRDGQIGEVHWDER